MDNIEIGEKKYKGYTIPTSNASMLMITSPVGMLACGYIKVETADSTAGPYEPVKDSRIFVDNPVNEDGEAVIENEAEAQAVANLDIDLIGCKSCVKITATNGTIGALALGDATNCPVKESI